jgi:hypothetical protein
MNHGLAQILRACQSLDEPRCGGLHDNYQEPADNPSRYQLHAAQNRLPDSRAWPDVQAFHALGALVEHRFCLPPTPTFGHSTGIFSTSKLGAQSLRSPLRRESTMPMPRAAIKTTATIIPICVELNAKKFITISPVLTRILDPKLK